MTSAGAAAPYRVFGTAASGNCHKVRIVLDHLGLPYRWNEVDLMKGETRTPQFLAMNPNGQVPVLGIDADSYLTESGAILCYLAEGSDLWPSDRLERARMLQWMFFEQYSHEPCIAVARFIHVFLRQPDHARMPDLHRRGYQALDVMERRLAQSAFFAGERLSLADIALYAYTHRADEGGFELARYPAVAKWLARCEREPGVSAMSPMARRPTGSAPPLAAGNASP
jgi:glutathione S-transferase